MVAAQHVWNSYWNACIEAGKALKHKEDLRISLGDDLVAQLVEASAKQGGEQYRPRDPAATGELQKYLQWFQML